MENESIDPELLKRMMMGEFSSSTNRINKTKKFNSKQNKVELDLHFEKIAPHQAHISSSDKLNLQLETLISFIADAQKQGMRNAYVIVGKGDGVLKANVVKLLHNKKIKNAVIYDPPYFGNALKLTF